MAMKPVGRDRKARVAQGPRIAATATPRHDPTAVTRDEFDLLHPPARPRIEVRPILLSEIPALVAIAAERMPVPITTSPHAREALRRNRNNVHLFLRQGRIVGFMALLMLRARGLRALLAGTIDCLDPDPGLLTTTAEAPAAIYGWALVAPGIASEGVQHIARLLNRPQFRHADFYARPLTREARRLQTYHGFRPVERSPLGLYCYRRLANRGAPLPEPDLPNQRAETGGTRSEAIVPCNLSKHMFTLQSIENMD